jgi:hypothetical protein
VTGQGAQVKSIEVLEDGLVGRRVLLDIPRLCGMPWLEPGEHVFAEDLEAAEREQHVPVGEGDILPVRTGIPGVSPRSVRGTRLRPRLSCIPPRCGSSRPAESRRSALIGNSDTALACERAQRWEFLFIAAPLRIVGGSGSPINPLAVL